MKSKINWPLLWYFLSQKGAVCVVRNETVEKLDEITSDLIHVYFTRFFFNKINTYKHLVKPNSTIKAVN